MVNSHGSRHLEFNKSRNNDAVYFIWSSFLEFLIGDLWNKAKLFDLVGSWMLGSGGNQQCDCDQRSGAGIPPNLVAAAEMGQDQRDSDFILLSREQRWLITQGTLQHCCIRSCVHILSREAVCSRRGVTGGDTMECPLVWGIAQGETHQGSEGLKESLPHLGG